LEFLAGCPAAAGKWVANGPRTSYLRLQRFQQPDQLPIRLAVAQPDRLTGTGFCLPWRNQPAIASLKVPMKRICCFIFLMLFLGGCAAPVNGVGTAVPTIRSEASSPSPTFPIALPPETIVAPTLAPDPTATADTRLPPESWQKWPIVPAVTARAIEIYRNGLAMGLDSHAFSKVGDCQNVKAAFMGFFDIPDRYSLKDYSNLLPTIDNFAGHFNTDGQAVRGGFVAASVLSPLWADPKACLAGENPLDCELRITKPIIVINQPGTLVGWPYLA